MDPSSSSNVRRELRRRSNHSLHFQPQAECGSAFDFNTCPWRDPLSAGACEAFCSRRRRCFKGQARSQASCHFPKNVFCGSTISGRVFRWLNRCHQRQVFLAMALVPVPLVEQTDPAATWRSTSPVLNKTQMKMFFDILFNTSFLVARHFLSTNAKKRNQLMQVRPRAWQNLLEL